MNKKKIVWGTTLIALVLLGTAWYVTPRLAQAATGPIEPSQLRDLVEYPGSVRQVEILSTDPSYNSYLSILASVPGASQIYLEATSKYNFSGASSVDQACRIAAAGKCSVVTHTGTQPTPTGDITIQLVSLSLMSASSLKTNGAQAAVTIIANQTGGGHGMALYIDGNLWPSTFQPSTDPYIIVNAEPFFFLRWHWWAWPLPAPRIIWWDYWWHDSHNHPNWYWGVYWWWRVWLKGYSTWFPWYWYYWHWQYWYYWHFWSTWFPYYCTSTAVYC
ncbi:hypothetical protein AUI06_12395 [archaeon 13_2_20CM_2_52_21]|nr:MAG: hypothetical protein AUI06_12395 [archaeon 13_2_20CM_2_52_21]